MVNLAKSVVILTICHKYYVRAVQFNWKVPQYLHENYK